MKAINYAEIKATLAEVTATYAHTTENTEFVMGTMVIVDLPYGKKYSKIVAYNETIREANELAKHIKNTYFADTYLVEVCQVYLPTFKTPRKPVRPFQSSVTGRRW